ncbi:MAG: hypothetical protein JWP04_1053 [Belnapia sp.]|nr:hypothetical protein [Belnapia sp.]
MMIRTATAAGMTLAGFAFAAGVAAGVGAGAALVGGACLARRAMKQRQAWKDDHGDVSAADTLTPGSYPGSPGDDIPDSGANPI